MRKGIFFLILLCLGIGATGTEAWAASRLLAVRYSSEADHTRIVMDLDGPVAYEVVPSSHPSILTIRLRNLSLPAAEQEFIVDDTVIRRMKIEPSEPGEGEARLLLVRPSRWRIFPLTPSEGKPDRLVIDILKGEGRAEETEPPAALGMPPPPARAQAEKLPPAGGEPITPGKERPTSSGSVPNKVLAIRQWSAPDHTRVVIDLEGPPTYEIPAQSDPMALRLTLRQSLLVKGRQEVTVEDPVIRKITLAPEGVDGVEVVLHLVKPSKWEAFPLKPYLDKPDRLVVDVSRPDLAEKEKEERRVTRELKTKKKRIIVIDPGHGGEDPGAIGRRGTMEKDIVLTLAKQLRAMLDDTGQVRAFLTRRGDYFIPLQERVRIAKEYGADLFVSLHTNGSRKASTRGTSIYCLSLKGASDQASQLLAQKENASDLMGGTASGSVRRDLDSILLDLEQTHTINESLHLGGVALSHLRSVNKIQFIQPRQAGFAVLKAPSIPSILVETAYVTHPVEEMLLRKKSFQEQVCRAIKTAILNFLPLLALKEETPKAERFQTRSGGKAN
jgi:N-acetylmuramoyl-L-alanine amidase